MLIFNSVKTMGNASMSRDPPFVETKAKDAAVKGIRVDRDN